MSAPETILVELPLGGIDAYTESKWLVPGKLAELENARFDAPPGLNKRFGYTQLSTSVISGGTVDGGRRLANLHGEFCMFGSHRFYAFNTVPDQWVERGVYPEPTVANARLWADMRYDLATPEIAYNGDLGVAVWDNYTQGGTATIGNVNCVLFNRSTGEVLAAQQINSVLGTVLEQLHTFAVGNFLYIVGLGDVNQIQWVRLDVTTGQYAFGATATLKDSGGATLTNRRVALDEAHYDVCVVGNEYFIIYRTTTPSLVVHRFGTSNANSLANYPNADDPNRCVAIQGDFGEKVSIVWSGSTINGGSPGVKHAVLNGSTLAADVAPTLLSNFSSANVSRATLIRVSATRRLVVVQDDAAARKALRWCLVSTSAGGTVGTTGVATDLSLIGKAFKATGDFTRIYVGACFDSSEQGTGYIVELHNTAETTNARPIRWLATFRRGRVSPNAKASYIPQVVFWGGTATYELPVRAKQRFRFAGKDDQDIVITQHSIERARIAFDGMPDVVEWGSGAFVAQGRPSWYDGNQYTEHGFAWHPEAHTTSFVAAGIFPASVEINSALVYESLDARGMLHRSTPGPIVLAAQSGGLLNAKLRYTLANGLALTDRQTALVYWGFPRAEAQVVPYRTTSGAPTGPGVEFYRAKAPPLGSPVASGTTIDVGTAGAGETDTDLVTFELLYTEGDILANDETPPCRLCCAHGNPLRLWLAGLEEDDTLAFSQPYVVGEAPRFNEGLRVRIGKPITAIAGMDDKLVAWSTTEIFVVAGSGPPASGDIDVGFRAHLLTSDVGCIEPRSVVAMPQGLMFQSAKGIYLLGRDLSVRYIGAPLRRLIDLLASGTFPFIVGAALIPFKNEVRFAAQRADHEAGVLFVYDYAQDQWTVDTLPAPPASCAMYGGTTFAWCTTAGDVLVESTNAYADLGAWVTMRLVTPWITPRMIQGPSGTLQGWQGLRSVGVLGDNLGSHGIRIRVGYDYESAWTDDQTYTAAEVAALPHEHVQLTPSRMNCKAFRVEVRDVAGTTVNEGLRLSSLSFEVDVDRRRSLLASAQVR